MSLPFGCIPGLHPSGGPVFSPVRGIHTLGDVEASSYLHCVFPVTSSDSAAFSLKFCICVVSFLGGLFFLFLVHFCFCCCCLCCCLFFVVIVWLLVKSASMSSMSRDSRVSKSGLKPTYSHDGVWVYINITCGSVAGCLYLNKLNKSKTSLGKCILANNVWYTPPEFEALDGKRARRRRQSLLHIGKPLGDYGLSCPQQFSVSTNMSQGDCEAAVSEHNGGNSLSSSDSVLLSSNMSTCTSTVARVPNPSLVDTFNLSEGHHTPIAGATPRWTFFLYWSITSCL